MNSRSAKRACVVSSVIVVVAVSAAGVAAWAEGSLTPPPATSAAKSDPPAAPLTSQVVDSRSSVAPPPSKDATVGQVAQPFTPGNSADDVAQLREEMQALRRLIEGLQQKVDRQDALIRQLSGAGPAVAAAVPSADAVMADDAQSARQAELEAQLARELGVAPPAAGAALAAPEPPADMSAGAGAPAGVSGQPPAQGWSPTQPIVVASGGGGKNYLNLSLDALAVGGASTTPDVPRLESGGHDPSQRGFTVQNVEAVFDGAVDPYFRGTANIILQLNNEGESVVELEEAYLTSTSLPHNLQVKAGTFFSEFGRLNPTHPHTWDFVDQPLVNGRFLGGDGLRGPGARVSWLMPTPFYSELYLAVQDSQGETATSFRSVPGDELFGREIVDRQVRTAGDMLYVPRWVASLDIGDTRTVLFGASAALGPNGSAQDTRTGIYAADFYYKWKPLNAQAGFPFVKWQTEVMARRYDAGSFSSDTDGDGTNDLLLPAERLKDWGTYSQVLWGLKRGWVVGLRGDYLDGNGGAFEPDPDRVMRWRVSPNVTWYPTEYSKLRLQWNTDRIEGEGTDQSLWLQMEFILGAHAAHKF